MSNDYNISRISVDGLADIVAAMETQESWTVDEEEAVKPLLAMLHASLGKPSVSQWVMHDEFNGSTALKVLGALSTGECFAILRALDETTPGIGNRFMLVAARERGKPIMGIVPKRLVCLARHQMLGVLFSPERFEAIDRVIRGWMRDGD